ncbi:MAG: FAD-dependent thymidylate synthase [Candidatus Liptonbacteria bacterium]
MPENTDWRKYAPIFEALAIPEEDKPSVEPFFTNLDQPVFVVPFLPPEVIGALCSRTSRAKDDLRVIFLNEFLKPFLADSDEYQKSLSALIDFLHKHPWEQIFSNPKGREFYVKWLAQYGDDSIAQMAGTHLVFSGISQVVIKHLEDMRVGIAPLEKSTRYVDYGSKVAGRYRYYTDPDLEKMGLRAEYEATMDGLFLTYADLAAKYLEELKKKYPEEKEMVLRTKAFDTVRGLLPTSTLSQVAFFANGQALEYALARSLSHNLGEIRWAGETAWRELSKVVPSFLRRLDTEPAMNYRRYLSKRGARVNEALAQAGWRKEVQPETSGVKLLEYDKDGEDKVIAGLIYPESHEALGPILAKVKKLSIAQKENILKEILGERTARWYKMPRALENVYVRFEIVMNVGAWRDIHRHRMHTQQRQRWSVHHGYDVPPELIENGLDKNFRSALDRLNELFFKIEKISPDLAQYSCAMAHRLRLMQYQNLRAFAWETELRTIPTGHPDYRKVEQEKVKLVREVYPLLGKYILADMNDYQFARRETQSQIDKKERELKEFFDKKN